MSGVNKMMGVKFIQSKYDGDGDKSSLTHEDIGKLHAGLQRLNAAINGLDNAPMFGEVERAKVVIAVTRDIIADLVFALHLAKNDIRKLKGAGGE